MSDETTPSPAASAVSPGDGAMEFSRLWAESLAQVLTQIAGTSFAIESPSGTPAQVPPPNAADLQMIVTAAGALRGEMSLRIPKAAAIAMARLFLGEPQDAAAELQPDHSQALEELLRQVAGIVATAAKVRWGETQFQVQLGTAPSWAAGSTGWWTSPAGASCQVFLEWKLSAALHTAALSSPQAKAEQAPVPATGTGNLPSASTPAGPPAGEGNLDLLMNVELEVMLRFGERNMLLREILELGAGSVIELDRKVGEAADLLLDGRIVARGEVVVVDGNYGLRVTELLNPAMGSGA